MFSLVLGLLLCGGGIYLFLTSSGESDLKIWFIGGLGVMFGVLLAALIRQLRGGKNSRLHKNAPEPVSIFLQLILGAFILLVLAVGTLLYFWR